MEKAHAWAFQLLALFSVWGMSRRHAGGSQASPVTGFSGSRGSCLVNGVNSWVFFWAPTRETSLSSCLVVTLML